jgi:signal transduction histidine kinase
MMIHRWLEKPRALAALTLAFALVPVVFAYVTFRAARERDAKLAETATQVLGEQLSLSTFKHVSFLNILRNQWRYVADPAHPLRSNLPPPGWMDRFPHLRAVAFVAHEDDTHLTIRWQQGRSPVRRLEDNLADDSILSAGMAHARLTSTPLATAVRLAPDLLAVIQAVTRENDNTFVRGYLIAWIDLGSMCRDTALPLLRADALQASPAALADAQSVTIGEGDATWIAWIRRGPGFTREYGTPTPWLGFAALGLSVLPLSVLVMLASRAGKFRSALEAEREVVRLKTHFLHTVSHEFRTPLSVIQSAAELIEHYADQLPPERRAKALAQIHDSTRHMNEMIEQVLTLSRIESGTLELNLSAVDVPHLLQTIAADVNAATQNRCVIAVNCNTEGSIEMDASLVRTMLVNALTNAVKYSPAGAEVLFYCTLIDDIARFCVVDKGIGIPSSDQPKLGQPFFRGGNVADTPGTGLGLAILDRCAKLHGAEYSIHSQDGAGTQVVIVIRGSAAPNSTVAAE